MDDKNPIADALEWAIYTICILGIGLSTITAGCLLY